MRILNTTVSSTVCGLKRVFSFISLYFCHLSRSTNFIFYSYDVTWFNVKRSLTCVNSKVTDLSRKTFVLDDVWWKRLVTVKWCHLGHKHEETTRGSVSDARWRLVVRRTSVQLAPSLSTRYLLTFSSFSSNFRLSWLRKSLLFPWKVSRYGSSESLHRCSLFVANDHTEAEQKMPSSYKEKDSSGSTRYGTHE